MGTSPLRTGGAVRGGRFLFRVPFMGPSGLRPVGPPYEGSTLIDCIRKDRSREGPPSNFLNEKWILGGEGRAPARAAGVLSGPNSLSTSDGHHYPSGGPLGRSLRLWLAISASVPPEPNQAATTNWSTKG